MKYNKIIMREGSRYKVDINIEKINEAIEYSNFIPVKLNNKITSVPIKNNSDLSDDEAKIIASRCIPLCIEEMKKFIKNEWADWMDSTGLVYSDRLVNEMIIDLFDLVDITQFENGIINIECWLNNRYTSHKYSRQFFGMHSLTAYGKYKNGIFNFKYCGLEG